MSIARLALACSVLVACGNPAGPPPNAEVATVGSVKPVATASDPPPPPTPPADSSAPPPTPSGPPAAVVTPASGGGCDVTTVATGAQVAISAADFRAYSSSNARFLNVLPSRDGIQLYLEGRMPGTTTLTIVRKSGGKTCLDVTVTP